MISRAVVRTLVGLNALSSAVSSGQPIVESGQSAEEYQVSRTSGSRLKPAASIR